MFESIGETVGSSVVKSVPDVSVTVSASSITLVSTSSVGVVSTPASSTPVSPPSVVSSSSVVSPPVSSTPVSPPVSAGAVSSPVSAGAVSTTASVPPSVSEVSLASCSRYSALKSVALCLTVDSGSVPSPSISSIVRPVISPSG